MSSAQTLTSFATREYTSDNRFTACGALTGFVSGALVGSLCGIAAAMIGHYLFYLVFLFPVVIGLAIGAAIGKSIDFTKLRDPVASAGAAFSAVVFAALAGHVTDYSFFQNELALAPARELEIARNVDYYEENRQALDAEGVLILDLIKSDPLYLKGLQVDSITDFLDYEATMGIELTSSKAGAGGKGINLGYTGTCLYWLAEIGIMISVAIPLVWRRAKRPFCEKCDQWHRSTNLGLCQGKGSVIADLFRNARQPEITAIADEKNATSFHLLRCPGCGSANSPVLQINRISVVNGTMHDHPLAYFCINDEQAAQITSWLDGNNPSQPTPVVSVTTRQPATSPARPSQTSASGDDEVSRYMAELLARQSAKSESVSYHEQQVMSDVRKLADEAGQAASQAQAGTPSNQGNQATR
jgi:hypothetical protein